MDDELEFSVVRLGWPLDESDLSLIWQMPNLPPSFAADLAKPDYLAKPDHDAVEVASEKLLVRAKRRRGTKTTLVGAVALSIPTAGHARVWLPLCCVEDIRLGEVTGLMETAAQYAAERNRDTISIVGADVLDSCWRNRFREAHFRASEILHMAAVDRPDGAAPVEETVVKVSSSDATVRPVAETSRVVVQPAETLPVEAFFTIVAKTYEQTEDSPALSDRHSIEEVRMRWQRTSKDERHRSWFVALVGDGDQSVVIGCVVLDVRASLRHGELVYMGIVPEYRGCGFGGALVRVAKRLQRNAGKETLILSVDAENERAVRCYSANGFVHYGTSIAFHRPIRDQPPER